MHRDGRNPAAVMVMIRLLIPVGERVAKIGVPFLLDPRPLRSSGRSAAPFESDGAAGQRKEPSIAPPESKRASFRDGGVAVPS